MEFVDDLWDVYINEVGNRLEVDDMNVFLSKCPEFETYSNVFCVCLIALCMFHMLAWDQLTAMGGL